LQAFSSFEIRRSSEAKPRWNATGHFAGPPTRYWRGPRAPPLL